MKEAESSLSELRSRTEEMPVVPKGPETHLVYFTALWLCGELVGAAKGRLQPQAGDGGSVCCTGGTPVPCYNLTSRKKCGPGESYSNPQCNECRTLPACKAGEELKCTGTIDFKYSCKECPDGTYLDGKTDCCTTWTDCSRNGFQTVRQGNRTHNVQCGIVLSPVETDSTTLTSVLAIVTAVGIFLVIMMMVSLLLCMCVEKREKLLAMEDPEAIEASKLVQLPQQPEDTFSCQYPEEERGHKMAEERDSMPFLAH